MIIILISAIAVLIYTGPILLFYLFPISGKNTIPDDTLVEKAEKLDEVKAFLTKYPDSFEATVAWEVPYLVVYTAMKSDIDGVPRADAPLGQPLTRLVVQVDSDMVASNATTYCFYARDPSSGEQTRYQMSQENIVRYLDELGDAHCWDVPPPTYAESLTSIVRTLNNATNTD